MRPQHEPQAKARSESICWIFSTDYAGVSNCREWCDCLDVNACPRDWNNRQGTVESSPDAADGIGIELGVDADDGQGFDNGLGDKQAVEWVAVMVW